MNKQYTFRLFDIEYAQPISNAEIWTNDQRCEIQSQENQYTISLPSNVEELTIKAENYVQKTYLSKEIPCKIFLLKDRVIGYASKINCVPGDSLQVFVHSLAAYHLKILRHGIKKIKLFETELIEGISQNVPDRDIVASGLGWDITDELTIPVDARPGLYSIEINSGNHKFSIPLIIESSIQKNRLLVLASETTWLAYNCWGGRSKYRNFRDETSSLFEEKNAVTALKNAIKGIVPSFIKLKIKDCIRESSNGKYFPIAVNEWTHQQLSWNRPIPCCDLEEEFVCSPFCNHLAAGEWRLLAWLERENIEYDYLPCKALEKQPVTQYDAVIISTHCEYWSKQMYSNLKDANENYGTWILNLGGNSINRAIELNSTGMRYIGDFRETFECESKLLGTRTTDSDYGTASPYQCKEPSSWVWHGIGGISKFGGLSLNQTIIPDKQYNPAKLGTGEGIIGQGASGWETDKRTQHTPNDFTLLAKGMNPHGGADMLLKEPVGKQGGVFNVSSITFGGSLLIDNVCSCLTKNIIGRALSLDENVKH